MELERKIYKEFLKDEKERYGDENLKTDILKMEFKLKSSLSTNEILLYEKIMADCLECYENESLRLINFVLKNDKNAKK